MVKIYCRNCGTQINDKAIVCVHCGTSTIGSQKGSGTPGILGFIFAIIGLILPIPLIDLLFAIVGLVLSIIGVTGNRHYKGLAIAGLVISIFAVIGCIKLLFTPWGYEQFWY